MSDPSIHFLPRPRRFTRLGGSVRFHELRQRLGAGWRRTIADPTLGKEACRVRLDSQGLVVRVPRESNRRAEALVSQLLSQLDHEAPCLIIEDEPAFATRGVMLDVSRCRVPTMATLIEAIDLLGALGANHLQLYTEHAFAYPGHEEVWAGASPITPEEVREIGLRCDEAEISLAANQNCFGHLARWLGLTRYAPLAETHGEWVFEGMQRSGPFSLCPSDPGSLELVRSLLDQLLPHFSSGLVNIGCDETADVGQGRSAADVRRRGARVYADFVSHVARHAMGRGFRPMFWADIALKHPEALEHLPREMIALAWGYEPDAPFADWLDTLTGAGFESWVCPGTSSWRSFTGRTRERLGNLGAAARAGASRGATGMLITDWGDVGHRQQWPISLRGIADGLEAAWNAEGFIPPEPEAVDLHVFGGACGVAAWLDELGDADEPLRAGADKPDAEGRRPRLRNSSPVFRDLHLGANVERTDSPGLWLETLDRLTDLESRVPSAPAPLGKELRHSVRTARVACERAVAIRTNALPERLKHIADELDEVSREHRRLWLLRSRPGGLEESDGHYRSVIDELRAASSPEQAVTRP